MLQQPQHLHEFPLAPTPHPGFQQPAQRPVLLGQLPPWQRGGLVQSRRLPLQQRQVIDDNKRIASIKTLLTPNGCLN